MERTLDFNQKRGFICDMDGVIYHGNRILPGVREFIQWLHDEEKEYLFLTNNSGYTPPPDRSGVYKSSRARYTEFDSKESRRDCLPGKKHRDLL